MPDSPRPSVFKYQKPEFDEGKRIVKLARTDRMIGLMQVLKQGGENNLHSHSHLDGFWMVLTGRVRFYGEGEQLIADLGPFEGVLIPRNCPYWFESSGNEDAELLQVEAFDIAIGDDQTMRADRINYEPVKRSIGDAMLEARTSA